MRSVFSRCICSVLCVILLLICSFSLSFVDTWATVAYPNFSTGDYEEYLKITEMPDFLDYFVRYEHIRSLGSFDYFIGPQYYDSNSPGESFCETDLEYIVMDKNGFQLWLNIREIPGAKYSGEIITMPLFLKDMRELDSAKTGAIMRGPLHYRYYNGKLAQISWCQGDMVFTLAYNPRRGMNDPEILLADYPMDGKDTIVSRLLSSNYLVALSAYYELIEDIPLQPGETKWSRMQYKVFAFAEGTVVVAAVAAPCIWLWLRHKKKRNAATMPPDATESTPSTT